MSEHRERWPSGGNWLSIPVPPELRAQSISVSAWQSGPVRVIRSGCAAATPCSSFQSRQQTRKGLRDSLPLTNHRFLGRGHRRGPFRGDRRRPHLVEVNLSYSPSEHLDHIDGCLVFAKALYETYPDARHDRGRWFSAAVPITECDVVDLDVVPSKSPDGRGDVYVLCGKQFAGGVIWSDEKRFGRSLPKFFTPEISKGENSVLRRALLAWAAK